MVVDQARNALVSVARELLDAALTIDNSLLEHPLDQAIGKVVVAQDGLNIILRMLTREVERVDRGSGPSPQPTTEG